MKMVNGGTITKKGNGGRISGSGRGFTNTVSPFL